MIRRACSAWRCAAPVRGTPRHARRRALKKVTYAVATADLNVGYPFATLPKALGYFEQEGLDVTVVPGQSSVAVVQLLLTGRADVGVAQPEPMVIQRAKNKVPLLRSTRVARRGTNRFIVNPDSPIQSVRDLKGKKVGVNDLGSGGVIYLRARLKEVGLTHQRRAADQRRLRHALVRGVEEPVGRRRDRLHRRHRAPADRGLSGRDAARTTRRDGPVQLQSVRAPRVHRRESRRDREASAAPPRRRRCF